MEFILPLKIEKVDTKLKLPIILLNQKDDLVTIEKFSIKEKEWFFDLEGLRIFNQKEGNRFRCKKVKGLINLCDCQEYVLTNYKLIIKKDTDNPWSLQQIQQQLDFAFKIIFGCGFPFAKIKDTNTLFNNSRGFINKQIISRRKNTTINEDSIKRLKRLFLLLIREKKDTKKRELLRFFLDTAMSQVPNLGISGALYVSILESIFAEEKNTEVGYRFSLRLSKTRNRDLSYQKSIKDLYSKRSSIFHGGIDRFSKADLKFLEQEACWAIEHYLLNPDKFSHKELDRALLS